ASFSRIAISFLLGATPGTLPVPPRGLPRPARTRVPRSTGAPSPFPPTAWGPCPTIVLVRGVPSRGIPMPTDSFLPVWFNPPAGVAGIEPIYIDVARNYGASRWSFFTRIALPGALPVMFEGLQMGQAIALLTIVAAEMVAASQGIGYVIWTAYKTFQIARMF